MTDVADYGADSMTPAPDEHKTLAPAAFVNGFDP
jgi:hypothetical protein